MTDEPPVDEEGVAASAAAQQLSLLLPAPAVGIDDVLVPARMINE